MWTTKFEFFYEITYFSWELKHVFVFLKMEVGLESLKNENVDQLYLLWPENTELLPKGI